MRKKVTSNLSNTVERTMVRRVILVIRVANAVLQAKGLIPLLRQGFEYLAQFFFRYGDYYLYEHSLEQLDGISETELTSRIPDFTFKIVSSNQEADELAADGLDFRLNMIRARQSLDKGAIAFAVFVKGELAHIAWVAMTEEAKRSLKELPYRVDFCNNKAITAGTWTNPKYRRMGLQGYILFKRFQFLRERGILSAIAPVAKNNIASQRARRRFKTRLIAEARYLKILKWEFWKEKPLPQAGSHWPSGGK